MRFKFLLIFFAILLLPVISAYNVELTLNSNVNDFSTSVYKCTSSACSTINFYKLINSGTSTNIYSLAGSGDNYYVEYDYKSCMAPHIYKNHVWDPYASSESFSINLNKKTECQGTINDAELSKTQMVLGQSVLISSNVNSAFSYPDEVPSTTKIPSGLYEEYSSKTKIEIYANNILINTQEKEILLGSDEDFEFNWIPSSVGSYEIKIKSSVTDCACSSQNTQTVVVGTIEVTAPVCTINKLINWNAWVNISSCRSDNTLLQKRTGVEYDANNCGTFANVSKEETRTVSCIYNPTCTVNKLFTPWTSWLNITSCRPDNTLGQKRTRVEYDANNCGCFMNVTHEEFQNASCIYNPTCTVNKLIIWGSWVYTSKCKSDDTRTQKRIGVEYDANNCGTFANVTKQETRTVDCDYDDDDDEDEKDCIGEPNYDEAEEEEFVYDASNVDYSSFETINLESRGNENQNTDSLVGWLILLIAGVLLLIIIILIYLAKR